MSEIYFLIRYIPFWAVPMLLLALEFSYVFWLRKKKKAVFVTSIIAAVSFFSLVFYYWAGGPESAVKMVMRWYQFYTL